MTRRLLPFVLLLVASCEVSDGAQNASEVGECDTAALASQCPPGSQPILGTSAELECTDTDGNLITEANGSVTGVCRGTGTCIVACNFQNPCECGVSRVSAEGVFCTECSETAACGNGICEGTENPQTCPIDCASACTPGEGRCAGDDREVCTPSGDWEVVPCRYDQGCSELPELDQSYCEARISPSGGTFTGAEPSVEPFGDPADLTLLSEDLPAAVVTFRDNRTVILATNPLSEFDLVESTERTLAGASVTPGFAVNDRQLANPLRRPQVFELGTPGARTMDAFVDDTTAVSVGVAALSADGERLAVSFNIQDQPLVATYRVATGEVSGLLRFVDESVTVLEPATALAFNHDGSMLLEVRADGVAALWNVDEAQYIHLFASDAEDASSAAFLPGEPLRVAIAGRNAEVWQLSESAARVWSQPAPGAGGGISPDGTVAAFGTRECRLTDLRDGTELRTLDIGFERTPGTPVFAPDNSALVVGSALFRELNP